MTEWGRMPPDGPTACPFIAFDEERDQRSSEPDPRHRCYAELDPAPRAIAHQRQFCLSAAFPVCPTFLDWAGRAAAQTLPDSKPPDDASRDEDRSDTEQLAAFELEQPDQPDRELFGSSDEHWSDGRTQGVEPQDDGGLSGAVGYARDPVEGRDRPERFSPVPAFLAHRQSPRPLSPDAPFDSGERWASPVGGHDPGSDPDAGSGADPAYESRRDHVAFQESDDGAYPPFLADRVQAADPAIDAPTRVPMSRPSQARRTTLAERRGPSWEPPRRFEAYPTLRTRVGRLGIPPLVLAAGGLLAVAFVLFMFPSLFSGGGAADASNRPGPSQSATVAPTRSPTPAPSPTPEAYVVRSGDTLERIARRFGVTVDQIMAVNPEITNPNRISVGQSILIPDPDFRPSAAPTVRATERARGSGR